MDCIQSIKKIVWWIDLIDFAVDELNEYKFGGSNLYS